MATTNDPPLIFWGRCRSGRRWFWTASEYDGDQVHGWADTPDAASSQANAAALRLAAGRYANVRVLHGVATEKLKQLNAAKRQAKAPRSARTGAVPPPNPVGYLYAIEPGRYELDDVTWIPGKVVQFPITRKTAKRVYYLRPRFLYMPGPDWESGYVDRQELERHGSVHVPHWLLLFAQPPEIPKPAATPGVKELKAAMAAAHPDRGGTDEAFIAARERYLRALRRAA
ncbi:hypothetical protein F7R91_05640 [Streptomyces luteolifulvus]|uniref:Uncharacterized protein n=1 Tax=Streptomyces luteolifulvus TaxID=2615112 RepID=A0A6H9V885_9ACTN|nr:hypothetical protein [Streptomyces luteolifulvus]KAB1149241.1 hypothetical protein F7R91_05640 [Streptomyces luteolifulvus]